MKVQTAVLLLCFLSGVFLSVVQAKPSPELMRELVALEKYLEKKEGSEGTDGLNENPGEEPTSENLFQKFGQEEENKPTENGQDKPINENNINGEINTAEGSGPEAGENETPTGQEVVVPIAKPEDATPKTAEEGLVPNENGEEAPNKGGGFPASGGKMEVDLPQEVNPWVGQVKNGRDKIYEVLDEVNRKIEDALDKLSTLGDEIREQFQNDDRKITGLEDDINKAKEKTTIKIDQMKSILEEMDKSINGQDKKSLVGKKSVQENAPARRSHLSDTEFLNTLHSLLTYS